MSARPNRWLTPPPQRTAYFCSARHPGRVLRVSSTRARVPASASTQAAVAVATPERWEAKLRAVRSAVSSPRVGPATRITTSPAATLVPSASRSVISTSSPSTSSKTTAAIPRPATTPGPRAPKSAMPRASGAMVAALVTSTASPGRSSSSAARTWARTASGSRPAASSSARRSSLTQRPRRRARPGGTWSTWSRRRAPCRGGPTSGRRRGRGSPHASASRGSPRGPAPPRPAPG